MGRFGRQMYSPVKPCQQSKWLHNLPFAFEITPSHFDSDLIVSSWLLMKCSITTTLTIWLCDTWFHLRTWFLYILKVIWKWYRQEHTGWYILWSEMFANICLQIYYCKLAVNVAVSGHYHMEQKKWKVNKNDVHCIRILTNYTFFSHSNLMAQVGMLWATCICL